jgi:hypothetical protein
MRRRICLVFLAVAFLGLSPKESSAQLALTVPLGFWMDENSGPIDVMAVGGLHIPLVPIGRVSIGPSFFVGGLWDKADPRRPNETHFHLTWMPAAQVNVRVAGSFGVTGGLGWGFVKKDAKTHLGNYKTFYAGVIFGLKSE